MPFKTTFKKAQEFIDGKRDYGENKASGPGRKG